MELYILLAIIWLGGVIFCGLWRITSVLIVSNQIRMNVSPKQALVGFVCDFFWFIYIPWEALKLLFKDV